MRCAVDGNEANIKQRVGSNTYAYNLLSWFNKLDRESNFTIYLKSSPVADLPTEDENWNYRLIKPKLLWTRWRLPLELYLHKDKFDVFFTPGHYAPKFCPCPLAISIMDLSFIHYPQMFRKRDLYTLYNWTRDSIKHAKHIFTISEFTKKDIIKNYAVTEDKITVTYPGFDFIKPGSQITQEQIEKVKLKHGIKGDYILHLGTLQPRKNIVRLLNAFAKLQIANLSLVIMGKKGWHYKDIFSEVKKLKINNRVTFTGYTSQNDKIKVIKGAKCMALISLYEGFGLPVLEAISLGCPVVIANTSSLPEIAGSGAIQVNPLNLESIADGLRKAVLMNFQEKENMISINRKHISQFSWEKTANKTLEVLYALAV